MADVGGQQYSSSDSREDSNSQDDTKQQNSNVFRNDGSFMEMFKKMQEDQRKKQDDPKGADTDSSSAARDEASSSKEPAKKPAACFAGHPLCSTQRDTGLAAMIHVCHVGVSASTLLSSLPQEEDPDNISQVTSLS
ncbi:hypothetical protein GWK47_048173 [Chionoecetes opilio]|uniref:Uncharacterized protein n=1 Tax=Chionoecetes opilio TaxID=41210 RepID=A0A8J4YAI7_CHIOP|nr:hypothetical protein GWK47_048173 [Chionoecetes opilio]